MTRGDTVPLTALVGQLLPALDAAFPTDLLDVLAHFLQDHAAAEDVDLLLVDYELDLLVRVRRDEPSTSSQELPVDSSDAGRAYSTQATIAVADGTRALVYMPVSLRAERLGVLRVRFPGEVPRATVDGLRQVATVVAYVVLAAGRFTDMYEQARRRKPLALDAEMQWNLLPVRAFAGPQFEVAGQLMPAYEVGGDSFDYSVESDALHVSVTDAVGHGIGASLLDALTVSALRNGRRAGVNLDEQVQRAHLAVHNQFNPPRPTSARSTSWPLSTMWFVTALVARLDLASGEVSAVNAGHPNPFLIRTGKVTPVVMSPQAPLGMFPSTRYVEQRFTLQPRDRLFFLSDGVTDAAAKGREPFGETRLQDVLLSTADQPPHEAVRHILGTVSQYQQGNLRDDATALCLDWHGVH